MFSPRGLRREMSDSVAKAIRIIATEDLHINDDAGVKERGRDLPCERLAGVC